MKIGFLKSDDPRQPCSESSIQKLLKKGHEILVDDELIPSSDYSAKRSDILAKSQMIVSSSPISISDINSTAADAHLLSIYGSYQPDFDQALLDVGERSVYSLDMIPRSTLAQAVDVLSSMASLAGYSAVLLGASKLPRQMPMMMTAAGTIKPSTVLILGAGVAGLQAIATARRLGARVEAFDVRSAVKEEVESLGAKFVEVEGSTDDSAAGGYAVEQTEDYKRRQKEAMAKSVAKADLIITTAQLRGRPAPTLIDDQMIQSMKPGSVIIDMASSTGGNVEGSVDQDTTTIHGVTIIGNSQLYQHCLTDASDLLSNNFMNYINFFSEDENGVIDNSHEILVASKIK